MNKKNTVLVCVTPQETSKRLVKAGKAIAETNNASLEVISVLPLDFSQNEKEPAVLEQLFGYAHEAGGEMAVYFSDDAALTLAAHVSKTKPSSLVVGFPGEGSNHFVSMIHLLLPELPISMVDADNTVYNMLPLHSDFLPARK